MLCARMAAAENGLLVKMWTMIWCLVCWWLHLRPLHKNKKSCTRHVEEQSQSQRYVCEQLTEGLRQEPLLTNHGDANQAVAQRLQKSIHASVSTSGAPEHGVLEAGSP